MPLPPVLAGAVHEILTSTEFDAIDVYGSPSGIDGTVAALMRVTGENNDHPCMFLAAYLIR
jgi:hypothetical protein